MITTEEAKTLVLPFRMHLPMAHWAVKRGFWVRRAIWEDDGVASKWLSYRGGLWWLTESDGTQRVARAGDLSKEDFLAEDWTTQPPTCEAENAAAATIEFDAIPGYYYNAESIAQTGQRDPLNPNGTAGLLACDLPAVNPDEVGLDPGAVVVEPTGQAGSAGSTSAGGISGGGGSGGGGGGNGGGNSPGVANQSGAGDDSSGVNDEVPLDPPAAPTASGGGPGGKQPSDDPNPPGPNNNQVPTASIEANTSVPIGDDCLRREPDECDRGCGDEVSVEYDDQGGLIPFTYNGVSMSLEDSEKPGAVWNYKVELGGQVLVNGTMGAGDKDETTGNGQKLLQPGASLTLKVTFNRPGQDAREIVKTEKIRMPGICEKPPGCDDPCPDPLTVEITGLDLSGGHLGSVGDNVDLVAVVNGGVQPYQLNWTVNGPTTTPGADGDEFHIENSAVGNYDAEVEVSDAAGQTAEDSGDWQIL